MHKNIKKKEAEIISFYSPDSLYNIHHKLFQKIIAFLVKFMEKNRTASVKHFLLYQISETVICQKLKKNVPGFKILEKVIHGYSPVIVEGV